MNEPQQDKSTEQADLQQKLAAILYADVEGYSRLTGNDEAGTHRTLSSYLDAFTAAIVSHRGNMEKVREHWQKCIEIDPTWSVAKMRQQLELWNVPRDFADRYLQSFAKAGYKE